MTAKGWREVCGEAIPEQRQSERQNSKKRQNDSETKKLEHTQKGRLN